MAETSDVRYGPLIAAISVRSVQMQSPEISASPERGEAIAQASGTRAAIAVLTAHRSLTAPLRALLDVKVPTGLSGIFLMRIRRLGGLRGHSADRTFEVDGLRFVSCSTETTSASKSSFRNRPVN